MSRTKTRKTKEFIIYAVKEGTIETKPKKEYPSYEESINPSRCVMGLRIAPRDRGNHTDCLCCPWGCNEFD